MIQIADIENIKAEDIPRLLERINPVLEKRAKLHERYCREASELKILYSYNTNTKITFEKFITDLATGYSSGKPTYSVIDTLDKDKEKLLKRLLGKNKKKKEYKKSMEIILDYIKSYNDDETENHNLIHDIFELTSCYEVLYENEQNEIVYSNLSPLQTVMLYDYSIPANQIATVRVWKEKSLDNSEIIKLELIDSKKYRYFTKKGKIVTEDESRIHEWGDVPVIGVETDLAVFEPVVDIINTIEQITQNARNTCQYNDSDCKLKVAGYQSENPMVVEDENGKPMYNPRRKIEDQAIRDTLTFYVGEGGDVSWLDKPIDVEGVTKIIKYYIDLMFQISGIPNTSDLAFNSGDLNASAIDRKFYVMNMATAGVIAKLKMAYLRRWELIFNRINIKKQTNFDFRDIEINIPKNLPNNEDEKATTLIKLKDILSEQTIIEQLGYNYLNEKSNKDKESNDNLEASIEMNKRFSDSNINNEVENDNKSTDIEPEV